MAVLNIRKLPDEIHRRLRLRAAKAGRSMEAEARAILTEVCMAEGERPNERARMPTVSATAMLTHR